MDSSVLRTPRRAQSSLSNPTSNSGVGLDVLDSTRKRQSKKDDQIRRKIEHDLKKKSSMYISANFNSSPTKKQQHRHAGGSQSGTVMSLKPSDPVICKPSNTVYEAAQLMSVTKVNCVLVVNDSDELSGIFTAKDLAFRVVGSNLNANQTTIDQIMTPNPLCAKISTLASDALTLMVSKGFRHLPVVDDLNQIIGVLDITKCYNEAMTKLERMYESSKKLYDAMEGVNAELGSSSQPLHVVKYFENLKSLLSGPTLDSVLDEDSNPIYCDIKTSVYEASILMKEHRTTAVLIRDTKNSEEVTGIFTSKDIVLRVIATGLSPKSCSVIRVMTPKPSFALATDSIHHALRQMFEGRYLNLPVVDNDNVNDIIGIVDVLKLTHHTLNQIQTMQSMSGNGSESGSLEEKEGPAWNKFWTSLDNDSESVTSSSHVLHTTGGIDINTTATTHSDLTPFDMGSPDMVRPSDSISYVGIPDASSSAGGLKMEPVSNFSIHSFNCNFDEVTYFKFRSPLGRSHRISCRPSDGIEALKSLIESKLTKKELAMLTKPTISETHVHPDGPHTGGDDGAAMEVAISYIDDEHDVVAITTDQDLKDCVHLMKFLQKNRIDLHIHHPNEDISTLNKAVHSNNNAGKSSDSLIQELILPGALFALATSIIVVFTLSRSRS